MAGIKAQAEKTKLELLESQTRQVLCMEWPSLPPSPFIRNVCVTPERAEQPCAPLVEAFPIITPLPEAFFFISAEVLLLFYNSLL